MRIAIASDLHLEFGGVALPNTGQADVLVLAGDICIGRKLPLAWFFDVSAQFEEIIYVPGNHEYYGDDIDRGLTRIRRDLECFGNIHVLNNDTVTLSGVTFAGSTLWTSMNNRNPLTMATVKRGMSDFTQISMDSHPTFIHNHPPRLSPERWCDEHDASVNFLLNANADVVITHFSPTFQSCSEQYRTSSINDGFHSDLNWLIEEIAPSMWIHGHTHDVFDYHIGKTRVICNPRGYFGIEDVSNWKLLYV